LLCLSRLAKLSQESMLTNTSITAPHAPVPPRRSVLPSASQTNLGFSHFIRSWVFLHRGGFIKNAKK